MQTVPIVNVKFFFAFQIFELLKCSTNNQEGLKSAKLISILNIRFSEPKRRYTLTIDIFLVSLDPEFSVLTRHSISLAPAFNMLATSSLLPAQFGRKPVLAPKSAEMLERPLYLVNLFQLNKYTLVQYSGSWLYTRNL